MAATPAASANSGTAPSNDTLHVIKSGDKLYSIAKVNGITVKALRDANNLKTDRIMVGQKLKIPTKSETTSAATTAAGGTGATKL